MDKKGRYFRKNVLCDRCNMSTKKSQLNEVITLRMATLKDADILLSWRNEPETRIASHKTSQVNMNEHAVWLSRTLRNTDRRLFIAEEDGHPVGTIRADCLDGVWELSWTVDPGARGRGVAKRMVTLLSQKIKEPIRAEVKTGNIASARIAEYAGMELEREVSGVLYYFRKAVK